MTVDHIVYGVRDLGAGMDELAALLGVRAAPGGRHVGLGTHNALLALGDRSYLEIIALDPSQPWPPPARPLFALDRMSLPRVVGWAMSTPDVDALVARARSAGYAPGPAASMSRVRPDGAELRWRLTAPPPPDALVLPFLIDWGSSQHPAQTSPPGVRLAGLRALHPRPEAARRALAALGAELPVDVAAEPALEATLETPRGRVVLR